MVIDRSRTALALAALGLVSWGGCTPGHYARQADRVAYATLAEGRSAALGAEGEFEVEYEPLAAAEKTEAIFLGDLRIPLTGEENVVFDLRTSVAAALRNSREFQDRKEQLYLSALALGSSRRAWNWTLYGGAVTADLTDERVNRGGESGTLEADGLATLTRRFAQGGVLLLATSIDLATDLVGGDGTTVGSLMEAGLTQPLLRGAWRDLAYEAQYRRERDFLFTVFEYDRFTQNFVAGIADSYYAVLQRRDELVNEQENIKRLRQTFELTQVMVQGGQVSAIQKDQAEQNLLDAQTRAEANRQEYRDALDGFKVLLGLPIAARLELNYPEGLERLKQQAGEDGELPGLPFEEERAIDVALMARPEVLRARAGLRDADRDIVIAADRFLPRLDVDLGLSVPGTEDSEFYRLQPHRHTRTARLIFDYPIDQTPNRDSYRAALLAQARAERNLELLVDEVILNVRRTYRSLLRTQRVYRIQQRSVTIAERRRRLAALQQQQGEASARDVLEAEEALRNAQNQLTNAIVSYTTTRLRFLASLGMLGADEKGVLYERPEPVKFDRIAERYPYLASGDGQDEVAR